MLLLLLSQQIVDYRPTDLSVALTAYLSILLSLSLFPLAHFGVLTCRRRPRPRRRRRRFPTKTCA